MISDFIPNKVSNLKMDGDTEKNPFDTGAENPGYDETGEINEMDRFPSSSSRRGSEDINNPYHHRTYEETSFGGDISEVTPLLTRRENELNASVDEIKRKFPNADTSKFTSKINAYGSVVMRLIREKENIIHYLIQMVKLMKNSRKLLLKLLAPAPKILSEQMKKKSQGVIKK